MNCCSSSSSSSSSSIRVPGDVVDNRREVSRPIQLNSLQCLVVRLQHSLNALAIRIRRMTVLKTSATNQL